MKNKSSWYNSLWIPGVLVAVCFAAAFYLRVALPYENVFVGSWIKFTTVDVYYFMRHIDNMVHNFPQFFAFDPFQNFPNGAILGGQNMFVYFVSFICWIAGLGSPSQHTIDVVSAYVPPFLGAISVVPIYFIGKTLFNRGTGILAAALIAITPGEFMGRTILGNTDRDPFEVILTAVLMLFLVLAVKSSAEKQVTFNGLIKREIKLLSRPVIFTIISGIILGMYTLTWRGSFLFVLIPMVYFVIQSLINQFRQRSSEDISFVIIVTLFIAMVIFLPGGRNTMMVAALVLSFLAAVIIALISAILIHRRANPWFFPLSLIVIGLMGAGVFYAVKPGLFNEIVNQFSVFFPSGGFLTVSQMQPILYPAGQFNIIPVWGNFTTGIVLLFVSLIILIYLAIRRPEPHKILFLVWSILLLTATLLTRRIALLFALNVALLVGYLGWQIIALVFEKTRPKLVMPSEPLSKTKRKGIVKEVQPVQTGISSTLRAMLLVLTAIAVFFLTVYWHINPAIEAATYAGTNTPTNNWYRALTWLQENTPEPLGDASAYTRNYARPELYPASAYGVVAWWDFGYWIIRIGRRLPVADPGGGAREEVAKFLIAQDEASANVLMNQLQAKYVIIDDSTIGSKFGGVTTYAGAQLSQFGEVFYSTSGGRLSPITYYYPAYFQNLAVRLYRFEGKKVTPSSITVINFQEKTSREGIRYAEITNSRNFSNYDEAKAFVEKEKGNYRIVSPSPSQSPVPLEALANYKQIYSPNPGDPTSVKIFEYTR